jgi:outer membrane protein
MKEMKTRLLITVFVLMSSVLYAQKILTYEEAVAIALQKNVDYQVQINELERTSFQRTQSLVAMAPNVSASGDIFDRRGRQQIQNPETNQVEFRDLVTDNLGMSINGSIPLFNGMSRIQTYRASQSRLNAQEHGVERSKQNTIFNVAQQYLQVLLSEELYTISTDNYRNQTENLKRIEGMVEVGALAVVDKFNQQAEVSRLESLMITAKNNYENDKLVLAQTLQMEPGTEFSLVSPYFSLEEMMGIKLDLDAMYQTAMNNRPDYMQQREIVEGNVKTLHALRGSYLPNISAFYTYGTFYNSFIPFARADQLSNVNPYHFYGFSFNIPILTGFNTRLRVQSARIDRENSILQENNMKTVIYREVKSAYQNFEAARANYGASLAQHEAAKNAYDLEKERYELGISAFFEFSQSSNALIQGQAAKAQAGYTLMFQETILNYQLGLLQTSDQK